jgi:hypothetical protein
VTPQVTRKAATAATGVRVQRYQPELRPSAGDRFWARVRRVLFGIAEPETGA